MSNLLRFAYNLSLSQQVSIQVLALYFVGDRGITVNKIICQYHSSGFEKTDYKRALNTLRYIHANPKAAGMQQGFFYDFSNYGTHDRLSNDGLTQWHPAFLSLGKSLDECAEKYRKFCKKYKPQSKSEKCSAWGSKLLPKVLKASERKKHSPGQMKLPWGEWEPTNDEIREVAEKFVRANCYEEKVAMQLFNDS